jgi:hypothetical protein
MTMSGMPNPITPENMKLLEDPEFVRYRKGRLSDPVIPDPEDYDHAVPANTVAEHASQYRDAQVRRIMRLYGEWKARQN